MNTMQNNNEVEHYTELAQIALTWIQTNSNPDDEERIHDQELLYKTYGKAAVMTGFQVALGMLLRHGANSQNMSIDDYITQARAAINDIKTQHVNATS